RITESGAIFNAWSDEPWINEGAAVRVSLVAFTMQCYPKAQLNGERVSEIYADLTGQASTALAYDLTNAIRLLENVNVCFLGAKKGGSFDIPGDLARSWITLPNPHGKPNIEVLRPWVNGTDIVR
ncbi:class I SAM-dependent DNA methyltransferase, partial [bacterium]|nr:class I SAM-dependent DNA methyltransferase [bacterium]